jgi:hypothetical protein
MLQFTEPVKFLGTETKKGISTRTGKPYEVTEAKLFVPDLGRVVVGVKGNPKFPNNGETVNLRLSVDQGSFQAVRVVYDEASVFSVVK